MKGANNIFRGTIVYDVADPRHHAIVRSLHLCKGKFFANLRWIDTGWKTDRVPLANLRRVRDGVPSVTECDVMRRAIQKEPT